MEKIELLNSEGPVLKAVKFNSNRYDIIDQYNCLVDVLTAKEIQDFVHGNREITDSKNRKFKYSDFTIYMKPNLKKLDEFIGIDTTGGAD